MPGLLFKHPPAFCDKPALFCVKYFNGTIQAIYKNIYLCCLIYYHRGQSQEP